MQSSTVAFFDELSRRGYEPLLGRVSATVRFDISDGASVDHRMVRIDHGDIGVSSDNAPADCAVIIDGALLDEILHGRTGAMAAFLRGALIVEGDPEVLVLVQRLFPGRPGSAAPPAGAARATSTAGPEESATEGPS